MADEGGCDTNTSYTGPIQPQPAAAGGTTRVPNNVGQEINESMGLQAGASPQQQAIRMSQLGINPTIAGFKIGAEEADRAGVDETIELLADVTGTTDAADCGYEHTVTACGMTGMMLFPFGKLAAALKYADEAADGARLIGANRATIDPRKLTEYALNPNHPVEPNKARVFESALGFNRSNADDLMAQLRRGVMENTPTPGKVDKWGARFTVDIPVTGPAGSGVVRTGWIYAPGSTTPSVNTLMVR